MSDSGRSLVPFSSQALNVLSPQFGAKGNGVTDDTAAIQAALTAAHALAPTAGIVDIWLPAGYNFLVGQLLVPSSVRIWAYGAALTPQLSGANQINGAMFWTAANSARFELYGGSVLGTGGEGVAHLQYLFAANTNIATNDVLIKDTYVNNWGSAVFQPRNFTRCRIINTTQINCGANTGTNVTGGFVDSSQTAGQDFLAYGNILIGCNNAALSYINNGSSIDARIYMLMNTCIGNTISQLSGSIDFESTASGQTFGRVLIAFNHVTCPGTGGWGINNSTAQFNDASVVHNTVQCTGTGATQGIRWTSPTSGGLPDLSHNRVTAATPINVGSPGVKVGNRFSSQGASQGRATLVAGTVTVSTAEIQANDNVLLTVVVPGGTRGEIQLGAITAGTSFVINSIQPGTASTLQASDTSTVFWQIVH